MLQFRGDTAGTLWPRTKTHEPETEGVYTPRRRTAGRITVQTAAAAKRVRRTRPRRRSALPIRPLRCTAWGPSRWDNSGDAEMARSLWSRAHAALLVGFARVCSERAHLCGFCLELTPATSAPGLGLTPPTLSAPGLGSPRPHCLHRDWGSPRPHLLRGWGSPLPLRLLLCRV
jgi:hypothetical protein